MADYTIALTDIQDKVFQFLTTRFNEEHETSLTPAEYLQQVVPEFLKPYVADYNTRREAALVAIFRTVDDDTKQKVEDAIGSVLAADELNVKR